MEEAIGELEATLTEAVRLGAERADRQFELSRFEIAKTVRLLIVTIVLSIVANIASISIECGQTMVPLVEHMRYLA